jgi:hypothetical protein
MFAMTRVTRVASCAVFAWLPAAAAVAQPIQDASQPESGALTVFLIAFCALVIGLLAYTARRMATLP